MTFAEKLQMLRKEKGWSQEELAARVPISRQAVSKWEKGTAMPDTENVLALADLFGVTTDYLLREDCVSGDGIPEPHHREDTARLEQNRRVAWIVCVGFQYLGLFWIIFGTLIDSSVLLPLLGVTIHISAIAGFEFGLHWHRALPDTAAIRRKFYRISVWAFAWFPCQVLASVLLRSSSRYLPFLCGGVLYLIICASVTRRLRPKNHRNTGSSS